MTRAPPWHPQSTPLLHCFQRRHGGDRHLPRATPSPHLPIQSNPKHTHTRAPRTHIHHTPRFVAVRPTRTSTTQACHTLCRPHHLVHETHKTHHHPMRIPLHCVNAHANSSARSSTADTSRWCSNAEMMAWLTSMFAASVRQSSSVCVCACVRVCVCVCACVQERVRNKHAPSQGSKAHTVSKHATSHLAC